MMYDVWHEQSITTKIAQKRNQFAVTSNLRIFFYHNYLDISVLWLLELEAIHFLFQFVIDKYWWHLNYLVLRSVDGLHQRNCMKSKSMCGMHWMLNVSQSLIYRHCALCNIHSCPRTTFQTINVSSMYDKLSIKRIKNNGKIVQFFHQNFNLKLLLLYGSFQGMRSTGLSSINWSILWIFH